MLLVIDAYNGSQTQTGECIVTGEIITVLFNKIDMTTED